AAEGGGSQGRDEQRAPDRSVRQRERVEAAHRRHGEQQHEGGQRGDQQRDPAPRQRDGQQGEDAQAEDERDQGRGGALLGEGKTAGAREGVRRERRGGDDEPGRDGEPQHPVGESGQGTATVWREREGEGGNADGQGGDDRQVARGGPGCR